MLANSALELNRIKFNKDFPPQKTKKNIIFQVTSCFSSLDDMKSNELDGN